MSSRDGFSLLEVMIFVAILATVLIAAAGFAVVSTRQATVDQHRILATRHAQEAIEWMRGESEQNWAGVAAKTGTFCLNDAISTATSTLNFTDVSIAAITSPSNPPTAAQCAFNGIVSVPPTTPPNIYQRTIQVTSLSPDQINVTVLVRWSEGSAANQTYSVPLSTILTRLDE